ncbi:MAG: hypothetical protein IT441_09255 [Phycisphaeraceae bacterium]|nr:hypothetical protein [Phycisphaeraceae bacterium]
MLKFLTFEGGRQVKKAPLRNACMIGPDGNCLWAEIESGGGMITCRKREAGVAALSLQRSVGDCGTLTLQTTLLPDRDEPYILSLELARHRLMLLYNKLEDWGMFDLPDEHAAMLRLELARKLMVAALCAAPTDPAEADRLAGDCLIAAVDGSEELALAHAEVLLNRRRSTGGMPQLPIGCGVGIEPVHERVRNGLAVNFDYVRLPTPWSELAPAEDEYRWGPLDQWVEWATLSRLPIMAGPIISFTPGVMPDWIYIWEDQYAQIRDVLYEHTERLVNRYKHAVAAWNVVSGLHLNAHLPFTFDQILDLTRMAVLLLRKTAPAAQVLVEIRQPFGEYFSRNPRSIPPMMYADLLVQSAVQIDGFVIKIQMGQAVEGQYTRDLMQISHLLDYFSALGVPLHVVVSAPSQPVDETMIAAVDPEKPVDPDCGFWRRPWSPLVQAHWLEAVMQITLSKPFVESVAWHDVIDHPNIELPMSGLVTEDLQPKLAFGRLVSLRRQIVPRTADPAAMSSAANDETAPWTLPEFLKSSDPDTEVQ